MIIVRNESTGTLARVPVSSLPFATLPGQKVVNLRPETFQKVDTSLHSFRVDVGFEQVIINANTRAEASSIAKGADLTPHSVNMEG